MKKKLPLSVIRAKNHITFQEYFYAVLMMGMDTVVDENLPAAMATDGKFIWVNPAWLEASKWTQEHITFALMHECIHVMSGDMWWATEFSLDHKVANMAADYWINNTLISEGKPMPPHGLSDPKYVGMTKLAIYKDLLQNPPPSDGSDKGKGKDPFNSDVVQGPPDPNLKAELTLRIKRAVQSAKQMGQGVPSWAEDVVDKINKPKVNWKKKLFHLASTVTYAKNDYSYRRHNRHYIPHNIIAPSLYNPDCNAGVIVVALDTSGSIGQDELEQFWGEIVEILTALHPRKLWVLDVDTDIRKVRSFEPTDEIPTNVKVYGRGGTSFVEPFKWVEDNLSDDPPTLLVYLTDLYGNFPANKPSYPTIWVSTTDQEAPFDETIRIEVDQ